MGLSFSKQRLESNNSHILSLNYSRSYCIYCDIYTRECHSAREINPTFRREQQSFYKLLMSCLTPDLKYIENVYWKSQVK